VAHVFVFDDHDRLLLQKLAPTRQRHAGYWGSSVAAYLFANETYEHAATRRLEQELGLADVVVKRVGKTPMDDEGCTKWITLFETRSPQHITHDPSHIARVEYQSMRHIEYMIRRGRRLFTPTFLHLFSCYQSGRWHAD
jgi:isopentenyldiphosphate isomerase